MVRKRSLWFPAASVRLEPRRTVDPGIRNSTRTEGVVTEMASDQDPKFAHLGLLHPMATNDADILVKKEKEYGGSWKKRGGRGAFYMLARKWDRIEIQVGKHADDIFEAVAEDQREEGILDDIGDLRRYLLLVESEMRQRLGKTRGE